MSNGKAKRATIPTNARGNVRRMSRATPREILAANLKRMIKTEAERLGERYSVRAWAMRRELDVRLIDRLVKGQHAVTLDKLTEIAEACSLQPWMLLIEDFDPSEPPDAPITEEERKMLRRLRKLLNGT